MNTEIKHFLKQNRNLLIGYALLILSGMFVLNMLEGQKRSDNVLPVSQEKINNSMLKQYNDSLYVNPGR